MCRVDRLWRRAGGSVSPGEEVDVPQLVSSHELCSSCTAGPNAAQRGHWGLAVELAQLQQDTNTVTCYAAQWGHWGLAVELAQLQQDTNTVTCYAAQWGHWGLAVELAQLQQDTNTVTCYAAQWGHWGLAVELVQLQQGVNTVTHYVPKRVLMKEVGFFFSQFFPPQLDLLCLMSLRSKYNASTIKYLLVYFTL